MVGRRDAVMYHCALCEKSFASKIAYNRHLENHEEPPPAQWPCPVCSFKFPDSRALDMHKLQTGHSDVEYSCHKCGASFQTETKLKQHKQFPSPCYADTSRTRPMRNATLSQPLHQSLTKTPNQDRKAYVDPDKPITKQAPVLPYGDVPDSNARSSSSSSDSTSVSGVYCHDCKRNFASEALYTRHCLTCSVRYRSNKTQANQTGGTPASIHQAPVPPQKPSKVSSSSSTIVCRLGNCPRSFNSQSALEQHQRDSHGQKNSQGSKNSQSSLLCGLDDCRSGFQTPTALDMHRKASHVVLCDTENCGEPFRSEAELVRHKKENHSVKAPRAAKTEELPLVPTAPIAIPQAATTQSPAPPPSGSVASPAAPATLACGVRGCSRVFRSEPGLIQHKRDSHGVGGQGLDLHGRDSWMLSQNVRNQLRDAGLLRPSGSGPQQPRRQPPSGGRAVPRPAADVSSLTRGPTTQQHAQNLAPAAVTSTNASKALSPIGSAEIEQGNELQRVIMRMLMTADIAIHHDGKIVYDGVPWIRIGIARQDEYVSFLDQLVHLRKLSKQGQAKQHVAHPTTFEADFIGDYPSKDFEQLPAPRPGSLNVVVLSCSKLMLEDRREEVVKVAAVDVMTGRPLLNYLVSVDPTEKVRDWRTSTTGLSSFRDFETARLQKFKVFKGWTAVRAALGKFVDQHTIVIGYNLRSDLDALRIRHGRCIDLIKLVEKAGGQGPLSKRQLQLDTLLRDLRKVQFQADLFGRDCLQDAYAIRELTLWSIKQKDDFVKYAKAKSLEYQRVA